MRTIGVVTPGILPQNYLGEIFRGIADTIKQYRAALVVSVQNPSRADDLEALFSTGGCDGIITVVPHSYANFLELCRAYHCEVVQIDYLADADVDDLPTVETNNREAMSGVVEHLLSLGHRRIGFITGKLEHASARQRLRGYQDALVAAGIPFDPTYVGEGDWEYPRGYAIAQGFLALEPRLTAIVASDDLSATGVIHAARQRGLQVGQDLSVTGFDDIKIAASIGLTTVRQPMYEIGRSAVNLLMKRLDGESIPELHVILPTELIIRQSTGRVPDAPDL